MRELGHSRWLCPSRLQRALDKDRVDILDETRRLARDIGLDPKTTPVRSPQFTGMAKAFVRTIKPIEEPNA
ncbi:hypothetical protein NS226_05210 [Aureimonas ureilytica]|uniref:Uncharacterized protein n=1 Tax=Aureimonas ureilytica TaxID=401562 RepID=A0A175RBQ0_9HYPH|nr:hypothetical protein NS226_05210 [Aureimonas ureilytica]